MTRLLGRYSSYIYAILRIVVGFLFLTHGSQILFNLPASEQASHSALITTAGVLEFVCGVMVLIGLFASVAGFVASGLMAVAYFMVHQPKGALPIQNQGELAALYCFIFLFIAAHGSGIWSVDSLRGKDTSGG